MSSKMRAVRSDIEDGLSDLIDSAEALLEELKDQQGPAVESLRARASATLRSATRHLSSVRPDVEELASRTLKHTMGFVRRDPWRAVALGALLVVAVGILANAGGDEDD